MGKQSFARTEQDRANRALRRNIRAIEVQTGARLIPIAKLEEFMFTQRMLMALVKRDGRVRYTKRELDELAEGDSLKQRVDGDTLTLTFEKAAEPTDDELDDELDEEPPPASEETEADDAE